MENWSTQGVFNGEMEQTRLVSCSTRVNKVSLIEIWSKQGEFNGVLE